MLTSSNINFSSCYCCLEKLFSGDQRQQRYVLYEMIQPIESSLKTVVAERKLKDYKFYCTSVQRYHRTSVVSRHLEYMKKAQAVYLAARKTIRRQFSSGRRALPGS